MSYPSQHATETPQASEAARRTDGERGDPSRLRDAARLEALRQTALLDAPAETAFDRLSHLAARVLRAPVALVSLVDADRQVFRGCVGLPEPWATTRETPLSHSFCQHVVTTGKPLIIEDARTAPLVRDNLAIRDLHVVAYAGIPLVTRDGHILGSFCVIDSVPRVWTPDEVGILAELAASVMTEIELRAATREAQRHATQLSRTFDAMSDGVLVYDRAGCIVQANPAAHAILGLPPDLSFDALSPEARMASYALRDAHGRVLPTEEWPVNRALAGGVLTIESASDLLATTPSGHDVYLNFTGGPLHDAEGRIQGAVLVVRDISERVRLRQEREQMLYIVSHELKTPLTSMKARVQVLLRRLAHGTVIDSAQLEPLLEDTGRMERLVNDLVDASRVETGNLALKEQEVDVAALCRQAAEAQITSTGRVITVEVPAQPVMVSADPQRVYQVLTNFLSNALKYSPAETSVDLSLQGADGVAQVRIRDQGPGIPPEARTRIFERFYRVPGIEVQSGSGVGLGLGLYLCRRLIERHGGAVGVESVSGQGSIFWFTLPLLVEDPAQR